MLTTTIRLRFGGRSTGVRLSKAIKVTVTYGPLTRHADLFIYLGFNATMAPQAWARKALANPWES